MPQSEVWALAWQLNFHLTIYKAFIYSSHHSIFWTLLKDRDIKNLPSILSALNLTICCQHINFLGKFLHLEKDDTKRYYNLCFFLWLRCWFFSKNFTFIMKPAQWKVVYDGGFGTGHISSMKYILSSHFKRWIKLRFLSA